MKNMLTGFLIFMSSAAYADINLYGPGGLILPSNSGHAAK